MHAGRPEEGTVDLTVGGCEPPSSGWELNYGPLEEQAVLLSTEPTLQPPAVAFLDRNSLLPWAHWLLFSALLWALLSGTLFSRYRVAITVMMS